MTSPAHCSLCHWNMARDLSVARDSHVKFINAPLETVMRLLQNLNGHLHGECVSRTFASDGGEGRQQRRGGSSGIGNVNLVECTLSSALIPSFHTIAMDVLRPCGAGLVEVTSDNLERLHARCVYTTLPFPLTAPCLIGTRVYEIVPTGDVILVAPYVPLSFHIRNLDFGSSCAFDIQLLSQARDRLYVRGKRLDLADQLQRARFRQMSLMPVACTVPAQGHSKFICYVMRMMVENDWHMDDAAIGRRGWVIGRWGDMVLRPRSIRKNDPPTTQLTQHSECPICFCEFIPSDHVINLPCNHNIHVMCGGSGSGSGSSELDDGRGLAWGAGAANTGGMCKWLSVGEHPACPCCRAPVTHT